MRHPFSFRAGLRWRTLIAAAFLASAAFAAAAAPLILVVGDSISAGYGISSTAGWTTLLQKRPLQDAVDIAATVAALKCSLWGDIALIKAHKADRWGNLTYIKSGRNFNPVMAMAADLTVAEVDQMVELGEMDPEAVITPSIFVDRVVVVGAQA